MTDKYITIEAAEICFNGDQNTPSDFSIKFKCIDEKKIEEVLTEARKILDEYLANKKSVYFQDIVLCTRKYRSQQAMEQKLQNDLLHRTDGMFDCYLGDLPQILASLQQELKAYYELKQIIQDARIRKIRFEITKTNCSSANLIVEYEEECRIFEKQYHSFTVERRTDTDAYIIDVWERKLYMPYEREKGMGQFTGKPPFIAEFFSGDGPALVCVDPKNEIHPNDFEELKSIAKKKGYEFYTMDIRKIED